MMKSTLIAAAMIAFAGAAVAEPTYLGYAEYAVEAETFEVATGAEFALNNGVTVTPMIVGFGIAEDFDFDRAEVTVEYKLNKNVNLYGTVETDSNLDYAETTLGIAARF